MRAIASHRTCRLPASMRVRARSCRSADTCDHIVCVMLTWTRGRLQRRYTSVQRTVPANVTARNFRAGARGSTASHSSR